MSANRRNKRPELGLKNSLCTYTRQILVQLLRRQRVNSIHPIRQIFLNLEQSMKSSIAGLFGGELIATGAYMFVCFQCVHHLRNRFECLDRYRSRNEVVLMGRVCVSD